MFLGLHFINNKLCSGARCILTSRLPTFNFNVVTIRLFHAVSSGPWGTNLCTEGSTHFDLSMEQIAQKTEKLQRTLQELEMVPVCSGLVLVLASTSWHVVFAPWCTMP